MAKTLNSISFTVLLVALVMASTGILKSEAHSDCYNNIIDQCPNAVDRVFHDECGAVPFLGSDCACCSCCLNAYGSPPVCWAAVEGTEKHCHCYKKKV